MRYTTWADVDLRGRQSHCAVAADDAACRQRQPLTPIQRGIDLQLFCDSLRQFLPARRYASAGTAGYGPVSVYSVSVCHKSMF